MTSNHEPLTEGDIISGVAFAIQFLDAGKPSVARAHLTFLLEQLQVDLAMDQLAYFREAGGPVVVDQ